MSAEIALVPEYGDGDSGEPTADPLVVLARFSQLVHERGPVFSTVVMELLETAVEQAASGECDDIPRF